jgi:hypothetical protein
MSMVLVAALGLTACASPLRTGVAASPSPSPSPGPSGITAVRIDRSFALLNAKPFDRVISGPESALLYEALRSLPPTSGMVACPGDATVSYRLTFMKGSAAAGTAVATYGGCRVVSFKGTQLDADAGATGRAFWAALFRAAGPDGAPNIAPPTINPASP